MSYWTSFCLQEYHPLLEDCCEISLLTRTQKYFWVTSLLKGGPELAKKIVTAVRHTQDNKSNSLM